MKPQRSVLSLLVFAAFGISCAQQTADEHIKVISDFKPPAFDRARYESEKDKYVAEYEKALKAMDAKRNAAILEFFKAFPDDDRIPALMERRWLSIYDGGTPAKDVIKDIGAIMTSAKGEEMAATADYCSIYVRMMEGEKGLKVVDAIKAFKAKHNNSAHTERLLQTAVFQVKDNEKRDAIEMFVKEYPDHRFVGMLKGQLRQMESVGKLFELSFKDAVTGKDVSVAGLKGKVVMIDWWATWCGPCVAEMPHVKEVYSKYKDKGFEIIGVSLDNTPEAGGLSALKDFVAKNRIEWPQYYQGAGWDSEFSTSWGIMSIPSVFLVDKKGILRNVQVKDLDSAVKSLLAER